MTIIQIPLPRRSRGKDDASQSARLLSSVQIELTNHCNYKCRFCPQSQWRKPEFHQAPFDRDKGYMDFDLFCRVVDEAGKIAREINFSFFGEPMMHPEFLRFMDYLAGRRAGCRIVMNTNLSYATRGHFEKLIDIGLAELRLSIDAATSEVYDLVRPGKYFVDLDGSRGTRDRFETICEKAEYWFSLPTHRPTRHVFTVSSKNRSEIEGYVRRWLPLLGDHDVILTKNVLTYGGKIDDTLIHAHPCNVWDNRMLTVDWTGRVSPCNLDTNMDLTIGSVRDSGLLDLHHSREREQMEARSKARAITPCRTCVDANNWSRNFIFRKGDNWKPECCEAYAEKT